MTITHSSDLGWKAGQDISQEFAALAKSFKPGDTFVFDHMYKISGQDINLPNNFTLAGGAPGAGIDIIDSATQKHSLLELGNGNTIVDLTVKHSNSPNSNSSDPVSGVDYHSKISIAANGKDDIKILNSHFEGNVSIMLEMRFIDNLLVQDTEFNGGYYQMRVTSGTNMTIDNTLFQNSLGDGIKTAGTDNGEPVKNATIIDSVFLNNGRDGLDTTGGFNDSVVKDSYFIGNGVSGIDHKTTYNSDADMANTVKNTNILITGTEFVNNSSAVIVTTNDRGTPKYLDKSNAQKYAAQNITIENSVIENTGDTYKKMLHVKDSYDIHWNNVTLLGTLHEVRLEDRYNIGLPKDVSGTNVSTGQARKSINDAAYEKLAGPDWSDISYPTNGTPTPPTPEPISQNPEPEPTPEPVEEPTPVPTPPSPEPILYNPPPEPIVITPPSNSGEVSAPSKLLDVYLAYTDTNKNVAQLGDGVVVDSDLTDGRGLTIYAASQEGAQSVGSVKIKVDGFGFRVENVEPFALFGDNGKGSFLGGKKLQDGTYTVTLSAYAGKNGTGKTLETVTFDFSVGESTSSPVVTPEPVDPVIDEPVVVAPIPEKNLGRDAAPITSDSELIEIKLINTDKDEVVTELHHGTMLSIGDIGGQKLTISAEAIDANSGIGSMRLELDGLYSKMENIAPYALFGDDAKGDFLFGQQLEEGKHFATLTAYSGKNGKGSVLEKVTVEFDVGDYDSVVVGGETSVISSYSAAQDTGTAKVSHDQMSVRLDDSSWKSLSLFKEITEMTVMKVDYKSNAQGEIQGIGFSNGKSDLSSTFFQLHGTQDLGIQDFNDAYETGSGFDTYIIPVGQYFTGEFDQLVLVNDDDAGVGSFSVFDNISFFEAVA